MKFPTPCHLLLSALIPLSFATSSMGVKISKHYDDDEKKVSSITIKPEKKITPLQKKISLVMQVGNPSSFFIPDFNKRGPQMKIENEKIALRNNQISCFGVLKEYGEIPLEHAENFFGGPEGIYMVTLYCIKQIKQNKMLYTDILQFMMQHTALNIDVTYHDYTALMVAVHSRNKEMTSFLANPFIRFGQYLSVDWNAQEGRGKTALHLVIKENNMDCAKILLRNKLINPNIQDFDRYTPLMDIIYNHKDILIYQEFVDLFLERDDLDLTLENDIEHNIFYIIAAIRSNLNFTHDNYVEKIELYEKILEKLQAYKTKETPVITID